MYSQFICPVKECNRFFLNPVILSCCEQTICQEHVDSSKCFDCPLCNYKHPKGDDSFTLNRFLTKLLNVNKHLSGQQKAAQKLLETLEAIVEDSVRTGLVDPDNYIFEQFASLRNQVDLHREQMLDEINRKSVELISQIDHIEQECKLNKDRVARINMEELSNQRFAKFRETIRSPWLDQRELNDLLDEMNTLKVDIQEQIDVYKRDLLMKQVICFVPYQNKAFGYLKNSSLVPDVKVVHYDNGIYEGGLLNGVFHGFGTFFYHNGERYVGKIIFSCFLLSN
jgi:hypothetical protein